MTQMPPYKKLFIGGDLSGIQKFLYNISSKKAAVSLKGRSKFLSEYMEKVCKGLCEAVQETGAQKPDVIYSSGGKFYLITENTDAVCRAVDEFARKKKDALWKEHLGQLGLSICYTSFTENDNGSVDAEGQTGIKPGILWKKVSEAFAREKRQKFKENLLGDFSSFFKPIEVGENPKVCAVTGIESPDCVSMSFQKDDGKGEEQRYVLRSVKKQIELGEQLQRDERTKTFEDYANHSYLGVLRMDVDGLGKRFVDGFDSIEAYRWFSKRLTDFFEKEIKKIREENEFREWTNIIYSGGDDVFVVGRWDKTIAFAVRIQREVKQRFGTDGLSISGGVAIVHPKFPIAKAAEQAGEAEDAAKHFNEGKKNAFNFLGRTVSWEREFEIVIQFKDKFVELVEKYSLSRSLLHKMMLYSSIAEKNQFDVKNSKPLDYSYFWHSSYFLTRFMRRYDKKEIKDFCKELRDKVIKDVRTLQLVAIAARWAELLLRMKNTDNNQ